jgi:hypothetical protein
MDVNEHERLSNITLRDKIKNRDKTFIAILHFTFNNDQNSYPKMSVKYPLAA